MRATPVTIDITTTRSVIASGIPHHNQAERVSQNEWHHRLSGIIDDQSRCINSNNTTYLVSLSWTIPQVIPSSHAENPNDRLDHASVRVRSDDARLLRKYFNNCANTVSITPVYFQRIVRLSLQYPSACVTAPARRMRRRHSCLDFFLSDMLYLL